MSGEIAEHQAKLTTDFRPNAITVTPSYMLTTLEKCRKMGSFPSETSLKVEIFEVEPWTNAMRREAEMRFDMNTVEIYRLSEVVGPMSAHERIEAKDGPHISEDHFDLEIIDTHKGEVLTDGELENLEFTTLTKQRKPVIRYRTHDLTRLSPGPACSLRGMGKITVPSDDMIVLRGVDVFPTQVEEQVLATPGVAPHLQIELRQEDALTRCATLWSCFLSFCKGRASLRDQGPHRCYS